MKIELEYIKKLLTIAQESEKSVFTVEYLIGASNEKNEEKFFSYLEVLADRKIIVNATDNSSDLKITRDTGGRVFWNPKLELRLTATGHDFIEALQNETVWNKIKKDLKKPSITTLMNTAQFAFQEYLKSNVL